MKTYYSPLVLFSVLNLCLISISQAQPVYIWQQAYGGTQNDGAYSISATSDGGTIVGGFSYSSISGTKTEAGYGLGDYWVLKLDASGNEEWQKVFGGSALDVLDEVVQTSDGGYFVGGYSQSPISGNKTENSLAGSQDIWLLRLDNTGSIIWQTDLGGNAADYLADVRETSDGGCIIGGYSNSGNNGDKSEGNKGNFDYWIIKLTNTGAIEWQNTIGGTGADHCHAVKQLSDGTYFVAGYSSSPVSFDKTEAAVGPFGNTDAWIMQLDASGNIIWQNVIGGNSNDNLYAAAFTPDNGAVLAMQSYSQASGDKTDNTISGAIGDVDYWVVKVDASGNIEWQNTIGGIDADLCLDITSIADGGFAMMGHSKSPISGDKTEDEFAGSYDYWVVGIDSLGNVLWDDTYGGNLFDYGYGITYTNEGFIVIAGNAESNATGNKTIASYGASDFWLVELRNACDETEVCNTIDDDCDGLVDEEVVEDIFIEFLGSTTVCQGVGVSLVATYTGNELQWFRNGTLITGATGISYYATTSGNYSCATYSECDSATSNTIIVTVNKNPKAKIVAGGPTTFCPGDFVYLNELPGAGNSYQWQKDGSSIPGATLNTYVATTTGVYRCIVTKIATGCFKVSNSITVTVSCKLDETPVQVLIIYPNPASNSITINTNVIAPKTISIYNSVGALVYNISSAEENVFIDVSHFTSGVYFVHLIGENGKGDDTFVKE
jgi:hypothetical protein